VADAIAHLKEEGVAASGAILDGSPFFAISDATEPGDLIVLTSHGRGGVRRWLLGSVAEKLVREAPVPVLLVPAVERGRVMGG
jgi:nucleotide-binding universal stress UspA family protein